MDDMIRFAYEVEARTVAEIVKHLDAIKMAIQTKSDKEAQGFGWKYWVRWKND